MGILDQITKTITQGVDRAKFEADKFQKTTRLQSELNELRRQLDAKMIELGQRAYELHRAGQINAPTVASLAQEIDTFKASVVVKEEEVKQAQAETYVEPTISTPSPARSVPIYDSSSEPARPPVNPTPPVNPAPQAHTKNCPACGFQMPPTAMFCPNCGTRVGV